MKKLEYFENEKNKSKKFIINISKSLEKINTKIYELGKLKNKTDNIVNSFEIECFNYNLVNEMIESKNRSSVMKVVILPLKAMITPS